MMQVTKELAHETIAKIGNKEAYNFQIDIIVGEYTQKIYNNIFLDDPLLIAVTPAGGKTFMAGLICYFYCLKNPKNRILIVAEGKKFLKGQFYSDLKECLVDSHLMLESDIEIIEDKKEFINSRAKIVVINPQTIKTLINDDKFSFIKQKLNFNLLIFDEAQNWYETKNGDGQIQRLRNKLKHDNEILLTGSPSSFNGRGFPSYYVSDEDLPVNRKSKMLFELVKTKTNIKKSDFKNHELKEEYIWERTEALNVVYDMFDRFIDVMISKLKSPYKNDPVSFYKSLEGEFLEKIVKNSSRNLRKLFVKEYLEKTVIFCHNIELSIYIYNILKSMTDIPLFISHSNAKYEVGYDKNSDKLISFKEMGNKQAILIVVDRAREAFNDISIVNVIDLTCSGDPELIKQIMDRGKRPFDSENKKTKTYIKVVPEGEENYAGFAMEFAINLGRREIFTTYNKKNFNNTGVVCVDDKTGDKTHRDISSIKKQLEKEIRILKDKNKKLKTIIKKINSKESDNNSRVKTKIIKKIPQIWKIDSKYTVLNRVEHFDDSVWSSVKFTIMTPGEFKLNMQGKTRWYRAKLFARAMGFSEGTKEYISYINSFKN